MNNGARAAGRVGWLAVALMVLAGVGCASVPAVQLAFAPGEGDELSSYPSPCAEVPAAQAPSPAGAEQLPGPRLRILSWNLHKNGDPGWDADLARYAAESDLLLIQEAALTPALRKVLGNTGHGHWTMAGAWGRGGVETGVLSGARVAPLAVCVQRSLEPLLRLPKAALITSFAMQGSEMSLVVANLHAINFTLGMDEYRAQLDAVVHTLALHRGPLIVAGDFNTWSTARDDALRSAMQLLGLVAVLPERDTRTRVLGRHIDHVYVRGMAVLSASAPQVGSSDHNPVLATLHLLPY